MTGCFGRYRNQSLATRTVGHDESESSVTILQNHRSRCPRIPTYAGLQWFIGETSVAKPSVVLGLGTTTTDLSNKVTGYDLSYTYSLEKSTSDAFRAGYLDGKCSAGLATAGLGYSFKKETVLGFAGVVGSHAKAFGESDGKKDFGAGLKLNTLPYAGEPEKTTRTFSIPA